MSDLYNKIKSLSYEERYNIMKLLQEKEKVYNNDEFKNSNWQEFYCSLCKTKKYKINHGFNNNWNCNCKKEEEEEEEDMGMGFFY